MTEKTPAGVHASKPMSSIIGNARAVAAVQRALASASPPHAWLFVGPEGVGKAALARWLAQAVNCERNVDAGGGVGARHQNDRSQSSTVSDDVAPSGSGDKVGAAPLHDDGPSASAVEPCGECAQCDRIARGIHADVQTVAIPSAEDGPPHKEISVDQIREVQRAVALAPFEGRTRVVIIDPADKLSEEAQNAFLKTLEEPPPNVVFVLIATQGDALLPTVRSRCTLIEFGLVSTAEIEQALRSLRSDHPSEAWEGEGAGSEDPGLHSGGIEESDAPLLARLAGGRPEKALALAGDPSGLEIRSEALEQARSLVTMPMADLMDLSERLAQQFRRDREPVLERLDAWMSWWRDVLLVSASGGADDCITNVDLQEGLREDARRYERNDVLAFVQALRECRRRLEGNVQARIALDAALVRAPRTPAVMRNEE